jgi:hypothetical protein
MDMYILIISSKIEWHVYFLLVNLTKMTYLTICQIEHLVKLTKQNDILNQDGQWCSSQMEHPMLLNWSR